MRLPKQRVVIAARHHERRQRRERVPHAAGICLIRVAEGLRQVDAAKALPVFEGRIVDLGRRRQRGALGQVEIGAHHGCALQSPRARINLRSGTAALAPSFGADERLQAAGGKIEPHRVLRVA